MTQIPAICKQIAGVSVNKEIMCFVFASVEAVRVLTAVLCVWKLFEKMS